MSTTDVFTSTGTWTAPDYVSTVWVRCWGGGGAGGGITLDPTSGNTCCGGGGAGGAFAAETTYTVIPGHAYTVTVGATRTGSTGAGGVGNDTWFDSSTTGVLAKGGAGGTSPVAVGGSGLGGAGSTTGCVGTVLFGGGSGANGLFNSTTITGPGGGGAGSGAVGGNGSGTSAGGGGSASGGSGGAGRTTAGAGNNGSTYGGGGGGAFGTFASHSFAGGNGAAGRVELEYTPTFSPSAGAGIRAVVDVLVDVSSAPAVMGDVIPVAGDIFLLLNSDLYGAGDGLNKGLWTWNSSGAAMSPVTGDSTGTYRDVREGKYAGRRVFNTYLVESDGQIYSDGEVLVPDSNSIWVGIDSPLIIVGGPGPTGHVAVCPAVTSGSDWVVTHNLGSKFLLYAIAATATPYAYVTSWAVKRTSSNTLTVTPTSTIAAGDYEIMIRKAV